MNEVTDGIKQAPLRRFRPYREYRDSGVEWLGEIPDHWAVKRLTDLANLVNGFPFDSKSFDRSQGTPLVRIRDLFNTTTEVQWAGAPVPQAEIGNGDILIGMDGDFSVGWWAHGPALLNQRLCSVRALEVRLSQRYLFYSLPFPLSALNDVTYATTVKHVSSLEILKFRLPCPSLDEQRAIATFLDRETAKIDELVARKERLIELLREKRTALLTRAVTRGLDRHTQAGTTASPVFPVVPQDWKLSKMRRLIRQVRRPISITPDADYREIGIRSWGKGIFHKDPIKGSLLEQKSVFRLKPGDFVLNIVFAWEGAVAVVSQHERGMIASHRFPTFLPSPNVDIDYLLMALQSDQGRSLMEVNSPGAAGRNRTLRIGQFLDEELPIPPLDTQSAIVAAFRDKERRLDALAGKVRQAIERLKEFRTAIVSAAITGKIDVRESVSR